jgi:hypothetical protein
VRVWLRLEGSEIVAHPHFTPERIRRFAARLQHSSPPELTAEAIEQQLTNSERDLIDALRRHHDGALPDPPAVLVDRLADHFLRVLT